MPHLTLRPLPALYPRPGQDVEPLPHPEPDSDDSACKPGNAGGVFLRPRKLSDNSRVAPHPGDRDEADDDVAADPVLAARNERKRIRFLRMEPITATAGLRDVHAQACGTF